jgi:hypothetical protein
MPGTARSDAVSVERSGSASLPGFERTLVVAALLFTIATYAILLLPDAAISRLAGDERVLEMLSALAYATGSALCVWAAIRAPREPARVAGRAMLLGFALVFVVASGEELSWGQHILKYETPEVFAKANRQEEVNLHNLRFLDSRGKDGTRKRGLGFLLNSNRFLDYFMFSVFVALPLVVRRRDALGNLARRLGAPRFGMSFVAPLALNYGLTVAAVFLTDREFMTRATSEIRETNCAMLCFLLALYLMRAQTSANARA